MSDLKTKRNNASVKDFINQIEHDRKRKEAFLLLEIFEEITQCKAEMWGDSIIGFGSYHYQYESGRSGEWMLTGFSPRKQNFSIYVMSGVQSFDSILPQLGKHKSSKACLYINKLEDVDLSVLKEIIKKSFEYVKENQSGC